MTAGAIPTVGVTPTTGVTQPPLLALEDLSIHYGRVQALEHVSLEVRAGEVVTLIGANGAGTTTTLKTICGLLHPREGRVTFEGRDISRTAVHHLVKEGIAKLGENIAVTRFVRMKVGETA